MKLIYSKRILLLSIIVFLGILVLNIIFTNLLLNKIVSINDKVKQLVISSEEREKELTLKDSILSSVEEREKFDQYFVGAGDGKTADFIASLESLADQNNVSHSIKFVGYEPVGILGTSEVVSFIRFRFSVTGRWPDVFSFLQAIENLPKVITVNNITLTVGSELSSTNNKAVNKIWSADLDFSVAKLKI